MANNRAQPALPTPAKRRGRPPRPGGPTPQAVVQRAYRARLKAAGKIVKLIDPADFLTMREKLHNALLNLELREQELAKLETSNADLKSKLDLKDQNLTSAQEAIRSRDEKICSLEQQVEAAERPKPVNGDLQKENRELKAKLWEKDYLLNRALNKIDASKRGRKAHLRENVR
jgi:hypothetical protein